MSFVAAEVKNMTTQQVVLVLGLSTLISTTVIWLTIIGADVVQIMTGLSPIIILLGGAFGWAKINEFKRDIGDVKELSNGRLTEVRDDNKVLQQEVKQLNEKIAALSVLINPATEPEK